MVTAYIMVAVRCELLAELGADVNDIAQLLTESMCTAVTNQANGASACC